MIMIMIMTMIMIMIMIMTMFPKFFKVFLVQATGTPCCQVKRSCWRPRGPTHLGVNHGMNHGNSYDNSWNINDIWMIY